MNHVAASEFMDDVEDQIGPIDILANVAGIMPIGPFDDEHDTTTERILDVNLGAVIFSTKDAARRMKARGSGHIVNVASGASWIAGGGGTYCALMALTLSSVPFGLRHSLARIINTDRLMLQADMEARAAYEARAQAAPVSASDIN
jgi:NAD(P)-dependent dehydrogenase (short-subunit alcohol dehydrogenase family)